MLPAKMGDGVLGSSSGGVNPTGASLVGVATSSAAALMVKVREVSLSCFTAVKEDCFHGETGFESVGVKREACAAMAIEDCRWMKMVRCL